MNPLRQQLGAQIAAGRRRKAAECARYVRDHGEGPFAEAYWRELRFWMRAASLAEAGDLTPLGFWSPESERRLTWLEQRKA